MLVIPVFFVDAKKSRTFSSLLCSADEQACRGRERAQPGSWPELARGNTPYRGPHAQFMSGDLPRGRFSLFSRSFNYILFFFPGSLVFFESSVKFVKSSHSGFHNRCLGTGRDSVFGW